MIGIDMQFDARQPEAVLQRVDLRRADRIGDLDHHFVRHVAALIGGRGAARALLRSGCALARLARSLGPVRNILDRAVIDDHSAGRDAHDDAGAMPTAAGMPAAVMSAAAIWRRHWTGRRRFADMGIQETAAAMPILRAGIAGRHSRQRRDSRDQEQGIALRAHG